MGLARESLAVRPARHRKARNNLARAIKKIARSRAKILKLEFLILILELRNLPVQGRFRPKNDRLGHFSASKSPFGGFDAPKP